MGAPVEARLSPDTLVVYPTALKAEAVLHGAARAGRVLLGHRLTTFPELTDALARDLGVTARTLGPEMAAVVVAHALDQAPLPEELRGRGRGLVGELLGVVEELCAGGLDPDDVLTLEAALAPGPTRRRVGAIARVYGAYAAGLARLGAVDRRGRERLVCDRLAEAERQGERPASLAGVRRLVFAELYDFSVLQFLIATSLIRLVGDAELVMLAHPENVDATRFVDRTWNRFVGDAEIADQALPSFVVRGGRQGSLAAALGGVFASDRPAPLPGDGSIRVVEAPGRYGEVEAVGRALRRQLAAGARPERLAILARDMGRYAALIDDVRRRFRLPIHFRRGEPMLGTPLVKAVIGLLRCAAEGVPRPGLETVLTQDYFRAGGMALVRCLRRAGYVDAAVRSLDACLARAVAKRPDGPSRARLLAAGARLRRVAAYVAALDRRRTVAAHVTALRRALRALGFRPLPPDVLLERAGRRDAAAWALLDETLDALAGVTTALGAGPVGLGDFLGTLLAALEPLALPDPAPRAGSIHALGVLDARGLDFDTVYLLGLDDGTFPAAHPENPILPDAARRELAAHAAAIVRRRLGPRGDGLPLGGLLRTAREAALEDPFLFFLALSMAEQSLVMTVPLVDERGNPTVRSPFVDEVAACLSDGIPVETASATSVVPPVAECAEPQELIARAALDRWSGSVPDRLGPALRSRLVGAEARLADIDRRAAIELRRSRYFLLPRDDARRAALADATVGRLARSVGDVGARLAARAWSPTMVEQLGQCGFRFFSRRLLGLAPDEPAVVEVRANEQGTLMHEVLARFVAEYPELPPDPAAAREIARAFVARVRDTMGRTLAADAAFLDLAWTRIGLALEELAALEAPQRAQLAAEGVAVERRLEQPFSVSFGSAESGVVVLNGTPDRVEVHRRGGVVEQARILDYKASSNPATYRARLDPEAQRLGIALQIPLYVLATLAQDGALDAAPLEAGFMVLLAASGEKEQVRRVDRDVLETVRQRIVSLIAAAHAGRFDVDPALCDPFCPYRGVCRYQPPPLEEDELRDA